MDAYTQQRKSVESVSHSEAEICINGWYFVDESGIVMRLAAKLYALRGFAKGSFPYLCGRATYQPNNYSTVVHKSNFQVCRALQGKCCHKLS